MEDINKSDLYNRMYETLVYINKVVEMSRKLASVYEQRNISGVLRIEFYTMALEYLILKLSILFQNNQVCSLKYFRNLNKEFEKEYDDFVNRYKEVLYNAKNIRNKMVAHYEEKVDVIKIIKSHFVSLVDNIEDLSASMLGYFKVGEKFFNKVRNANCDFNNILSQYDLIFRKKENHS